MFVAFRRLTLISVLVCGAMLAGCGGASTTIVENSAPPASTQSDSSSSAATTTRPQIFSGSGQQNLGTITVPSDSTISWNCPTCGDTNFIINNAQSDPNSISTNALDQTQGVDPIPAGVYHTVVVDTTGGPWTVAIGTTAPPPGSAGITEAQPGTSQCDPNVSVTGADCPFAENTFYEYWTHQGASAFSVYSPSDQSTSTVTCSSSGDIVCTTAQGATVRFPQSAIDSYTQAQANSYAASHDIGH